MAASESKEIKPTEKRGASGVGKVPTKPSQEKPTDKPNKSKG